MEQKKRKRVFKHILSIALVFFMLFSVVPADTFVLTAEAKTAKEGSGFGKLNYKDWCQAMSPYKDMRSGGCRIVVYTKLLHEAGYTKVKTPDDFFKWGMGKGYYKDNKVYEWASFGEPLIAYVTQQGGKASLKKEISIKGKKKAEVADTIMKYIEAGYYCILSSPKPKMHTTYVGREDSLKAGTPILLDSSSNSTKDTCWTGTYGNIIKWTDYTARNMTKLRVYQINEPKKTEANKESNKQETNKEEIKSYKITLDKQNSTSKQYIYEGYGKGFYSDSKCTKAITKVAVPTRSGYDFKGYYTKKSGKGKQYIDASGKITAGKKTFSKNTTLYAYWKKIPVYKVTLDRQNSTSKQYIYEGYGKGFYSNSKCTKAISKVTVPTRNGYDFQGYYTKKSGKGKQYIDASGKITAGNKTFSKNTTLYAYWIKAPIYKLTLDSQNGSSKQYIYVKYGKGIYSDSKCTKIITKVTVPAKSGYTFEGYYTEKNGKGTRYIDFRGQIIGKNNGFKKDTTLYAYWKEKNPVYKITLDPKNGGPVQYLYYKKGVGVFSDSACKNKVTHISVPVKEGYDFMGYYTVDGGLGACEILSSGEVIMHHGNSITQDTTLYAHWEKSAAVYKITLKPQNGGVDQYIYVKFGVGFYSDSACTKAITSVTVPIKKDWVFNGYWTENTDAGFRHINENGLILADNTKITKDITLYGLWTKNTSVYKITLDDQDGTANSDIYVKYGVWYCRYWNGTSQIEKLRLSVKKKEGYTCGGYYTGKNGTGIRCTDAAGNFVASTTTFTSDTTWYLYWIKN